jgi:hypothetical protein
MYVVEETKYKTIFQKICTKHIYPTPGPAKTGLNNIRFPSKLKFYQEMTFLSFRVYVSKWGK